MFEFVFSVLVFFFLQVHDYLRSKLCSLYENDCIFDKFECAWNGSDRYRFLHENVAAERDVCVCRLW